MDLLNYILDDLIPWHKVDGLRDFSLLEVNRYVFVVFSLILGMVKLHEIIGVCVVILGMSME